MLVIAGAPANASAETVFRLSQSLNIEEIFLQAAQPEMMLAPISSSPVQPANRPENEVTLESPPRTPSGMLLSEVQPLKTLVNEVTAVLVANSPAGSVVSDAQPLKASLKAVTRVKPSNSPAGTSVSEVQSLKMLLKAVFVTVVKAPLLLNSSAGTLCSSLHPVKQLIKVVTLPQPANRSAGTLWMAVLLNALWKLVTLWLLANKPAGTDFRLVPEKSMRNESTSGLLANRPAGTDSNDSLLANSELKVVTFLLLAKSFSGTVFSLPFEKMIEQSVSSVLREKKSSSIWVIAVPEKSEPTEVIFVQL